MRQLSYAVVAGVGHEKIATRVKGDRRRPTQLRLTCRPAVTNESNAPSPRQTDSDASSSDFLQPSVP